MPQGPSPIRGSMLDPVLSLALSLHSNKGVYALLLGSGISRAAQIPTGWEIVEDLIRKIATLRGQECGTDPAAWYQTAFDGPPNYSDLLAEIARTPAERAQLLRNYFEPTEDEKNHGVKVPTTAHRAIARLAAKGYIRVILTTNFDRLLEAALEAEGVRADVITTADAVEGAMPLVHTSCCLIKIHGDYADSRIKNTPDELAQYDKRIDLLLDKIFDDFGLIVCGWSAEWDHALRAALERCPSRRFAAYWTVVGQLTDAAARLVDLRKAQSISIKSSDDFFSDLCHKIESLEAVSGSHPLSAKLAVASVKRFLVEERFRIDLNDLIVGETERTFPLISQVNFPVQGGSPPTGEQLAQRLSRYESATEILRAIVTTGCYWGGREHARLWPRAIGRIANPSVQLAGFTVWINLRLYPALLLIYSGGIAALAAGAHETFSRMMTETKLRGGSVEGERPIVSEVYALNVIDEALIRQIPEYKNLKTPISQYLYKLIREPLRELLPDDQDYEKQFDRFEYLLALLHVYDSGREWGPPGCFAWRGGFRSPGRAVIELNSEIEAAGSNWPLFRAGLFDSSIDNFRSAQERFGPFLARVSRSLMF